MLLYIDVFLVRETVIVTPFQRNYDCYCDYFILLLFNQVRFRLRLGCPGSHMSLYGPTFHVTRVDLCIMFLFQCNIYISCIMSCESRRLPQASVGFYRLLCYYRCITNRPKAMLQKISKCFQPNIYINCIYLMYVKAQVLCD